VGEGGSLARSGSETDEGFSPQVVFVERTPHPPALRFGTFSHKGRRNRGCATSVQLAGNELQVSFGFAPEVLVVWCTKNRVRFGRGRPI